MTRFSLNSSAFFALAFIWLVAAPVNAQDTQAAIGQPAPDFTLLDEDGNTHTLNQYRGQVVVLEWTCSTCPFVVRHYEGQGMQSTAADLTAQNAVWLAVDSTNYNTPETTQAWKTSMGLSHPTLQDQDGAVGRLYGAQTTPHMFIIDAAGVLRYQGAIDDNPRGTVENPTNYAVTTVTALLAGQDPTLSSSDPYGCSVKYADE